MEKIEEKGEKRNKVDVNENAPVKSKKIEEKRDTTGDTKIFQPIKREDIEREKRKQQIQKENKNEKLNNYQQKNQEKVAEKIPEKNQEKIPEKKLNDYQNNIKEESKNNATKVLVALLILIIITLTVIIFSTIFAVFTINSNKIINGVKINNIDLSNLTKEQAIDLIQEKINKEEEEESKIIVKKGNYSKEISIGDIAGKFEIEQAVENAYNIGRDKDIINNNYKTLQTMIFGSDVGIQLTYEEEYLNKVIKEMTLEIPGMALDSSYVIDGDKLIIKNSKDGMQINKEEFLKQLKNAVLSDNKSFELPIEQSEKKEINIEKIQKEIYKQPVNAYYTTEPRQIFKEEDGIDFAISIEEAKKIIAEEKDEYEIPLKRIEPEIKIADLDAGAYPDLLATFTTYYGTGDVNRNTNISLAAQSINSVIVMPGEVFSYNDLIGECSTKTGYKAATIYLNGELSTGIGGGICQVSTTLYNAVLRANLEIVQRRNHSLGVTYVPAGHDAMVSIGSSDFKFKNNRDYPVKVVAYTGAGNVTCQIYGLKKEQEYEVKLETRTLENTEEKLKVETYKVLYLNGNVVSRTWLSTDTYKKH